MYLKSSSISLKCSLITLAMNRTNSSTEYNYLGPWRGHGGGHGGTMEGGAIGLYHLGLLLLNRVWPGVVKGGGGGGGGGGSHKCPIDSPLPPRWLRPPLPAFSLPGG